MNLFDTYENEFKEATTTIKGKIAEFTRTKDRKVASQVDSELDVARDTLENMKLVVTSTFGGDSLAARVKGYKSELEQLHESWQRARLMGGAEKWAGGTAQLQKTSKDLQETKQIARETEEIGMGALNTLYRDRQVLEGAAHEMDNIGGGVTEARSILSSMSRKIIYSKLILIFIIIVEFLGIAAIVFFKWILPLINAFTPPPGPQPAPGPQPPVPVPAPGVNITM